MLSEWPLNLASIRAKQRRSLKALEGRDRHQEVAPHIADHPLDLPLVVALAGTAEPVREQVVGLEFREGPGAFTASIPQDPGHRQLGVVVQDALGHSTQECEGRDMAVQEGLGGLGRVGLDEASVAMGQVQDEAVGFLFHPADDHPGLAKVALGVARRMGQGHEHLLRPAAVLPHVVLDYGVLAAEPMLVPEPLEDPLGCVALLSGDLSVSFQYGVNHPAEGLQLGPAGWVLAPVAWWYRIGQHLAHRVPVQARRTRA